MAGVSPDASVTREAALRGSSRRRLGRTAVVYAEGDPPEHVFRVHDGLVKLVATGPGGVTSLVAFRGPGEWLGEHSALDGMPRSTTAIVVRDATITALDRESFVDAVRGDADLAQALLVSLAGHVRATTGHVLAVASSDPTALVAQRLHALVSDARFAAIRSTEAGAVTIDMPISHDELAMWAGVSRRSVETSLQRLRVAGIVTTARMQMVVEDVAALARRARREPGSDG